MRRHVLFNPVVGLRGARFRRRVPALKITMSTGREITYIETGRGMVWSEHFADESELHAALMDAAGKCEIERLTALLPHMTHAKSTVLENAIEHAAEAGHWTVHRLLSDRVDTLNAKAWNVGATAVRAMR